jgi:hypothetical protein
MIRLWRASLQDHDKSAERLKNAACVAPVFFSVVQWFS